MCGRYSLAAPDPAALRARFGIAADTPLSPRYNIAPGDAVLAITVGAAGAPRAETLRWGLVPHWAREPTPPGMMFNARRETIAEKPALRDALRRFRCLIPADGFYEWQPGGGAGHTRPFRITRTDGRPFAFAGLWSVWHRGEADAIRSCTIITVAANSVVAPLHDRMPAILEPEQERAWLDPSATQPALLALLDGLPADETAAHPVGTAVNDARYDGPLCLAAPEPSLF